MPQMLPEAEGKHTFKDILSLCSRMCHLMQTRRGRIWIVGKAGPASVSMYPGVLRMLVAWQGCPPFILDSSGSYTKQTSQLREGTRAG